MQRDRKIRTIGGAVGSDSAEAPDGANIRTPSAESPESKVFRNIRGVIFDFDGTLYDNARFGLYLVLAYPPDALRTWRERLVRRRFEGRDFSTPERYYRAFFGIMGKANRRPPHVMRNWYFRHYMPRMIRVLKKCYAPRPGVKELFEWLDSPAGVRNLPDDFPILAIYSDYPFLKERMEAVGAPISPKVRLYGPESFGAQKPAPRPFWCIAQDMGIRPEEILVIGDRDDTDGYGAYNAGMRFLCLQTGRRRYFKIDPYRNYPEPDEQQAGPMLPMYSATWDELRNYYRKYCQTTE